MRLISSHWEWWGAIGLGILTAFGSWVWLQQQVHKVEVAPVLAAARDLTAPRIITAKDIAEVKLPRQSLPPPAITSHAEIIGQLLVSDKGEREVFVRRDLNRPHDPESDAVRVPAGAVGVVAPASWFRSGFPKLRPGDWLTVYAAGVAGSGKIGSEVLLPAASVVAVAADRQGVLNSVLLVLTPAAARRLLEAHAISAPLLAAVESAAAFPAATTSSGQFHP